MCENQVTRHHAAPKPMQHSMKNVTLFPYQFICLCWKIALDIALVDLTLSLDTERVTAMVLQDVSLRFCVPSENGVTRWIAIVTAIVLALRSLIKNWIKNREAAASRFTLLRLYWQVNQRMNEHHHQPLLFCSLQVCPFLILSFQVVCFWENVQHDVACFSIQVSRCLDSSFQWSLSRETDIWKKTQTEF